MDQEVSIEELEFENFLTQHKKQAKKRLVFWMIILAITTIGTLGGMFWLFQSAAKLFMR